MENSSVLDSGSIIDSASMLFGSSPQAPSRQATTQQHRAMARRLEQLNAAMGHSETPEKPIAVIENPPALAAKGFGSSTLLITAVVSAMAGAALMALVTPRQPTPISPLAAVQPAAPLAPAAPAAALVASQPAISEEKMVGDLLESWRSAWAQRDVAAYLNAYSLDFSPADGSGRDSWLAARRKKLSSAAAIEIQIRNLAIERIDEHQFKASFLQDYASGSYRETARPKTLQIARAGGDWKITREWQEAAPLKK